MPVDRTAWKKAQEKVKKALRVLESTRKDFWSKEFPDTYQAQGNIIQEQPSDMWFLFQGQFGLLEIKSSHQARFPLKDIRSGQYSGAMRVTAAGGTSTFLLAKLPEWDWYTVPGMEFVKRRRQGDSSMGWDEMTPVNLKAVEFLPINLGG